MVFPFWTQARWLAFYVHGSRRAPPLGCVPGVLALENTHFHLYPLPSLESPTALSGNVIKGCVAPIWPSLLSSVLSPFSPFHLSSGVFYPLPHLHFLLSSSKTQGKLPRLARRQVQLLGQ